MSSTDDPVRDALRGYAASVAGHPVPPASLVWFRAERRRRALALRRAQRPLRIMQAIGLLCAVIAVGGAGVRFGSMPPLPAAPLRALAVATSGLVLLGCWAMLLASRQSS